MYFLIFIPFLGLIIFSWIRIKDVVGFYDSKAIGMMDYLTPFGDFKAVEDLRHYFEICNEHDIFPIWGLIVVLSIPSTLILILCVLLFSM